MQKWPGSPLIEPTPGANIASELVDPEALSDRSKPHGEPVERGSNAEFTAWGVCRPLIAHSPSGGQ